MFSKKSFILVVQLVYYFREDKLLVLLSVKFQEYLEFLIFVALRRQFSIFVMREIDIFQNIRDLN